MQTAMAFVTFLALASMGLADANDANRKTPTTTPAPTINLVGCPAMMGECPETASLSIQPASLHQRQDSSGLDTTTPCTSSSTSSSSAPLNALSVLSAAIATGTDSVMVSFPSSIFPTFMPPSPLRSTASITSNSVSAMHISTRITSSTHSLLSSSTSTTLVIIPATVSSSTQSMSTSTTTSTQPTASSTTTSTRSIITSTTTSTASIISSTTTTSTQPTSISTTPVQSSSSHSTASSSTSTTQDSGIPVVITYGPPVTTTVVSTTLRSTSTISVVVPGSSTSTKLSTSYITGYLPNHQTEAPAAPTGGASIDKLPLAMCGLLAGAAAMAVA